MTILTFINLVALVFLCSINPNSENGSRSLFRLLQGDHDDFKVAWYFDTGAQLCLNLICYVIVANLYVVTCALLKCTQRCIDRGCKLHLSDDYP